MKPKCRICIAEDHTILREGLRELLMADMDLEVTCEAKDGIETLQVIRKNQPELVLLDLSMPKMNGLEVIAEIKKLSPHPKILVLTVHNTEEYIVCALRAGANGYVLKDTSRAELILAIKSVLGGKIYISPDIAKKIVEGYLDGRKPSLSKLLPETLTPRERELLKLIAEGHKNREIAESLGISVKTVEKHRGNLMAKLNLHNVAALTAFAIEKGLVADNIGAYPGVLSRADSAPASIPFR
ncbi:response regulator [Methylomagnum sp.]